MHAFAYISLEINPSNIDVNVHPTKHEVHFLYEDEIVEKIKVKLEAHLLGSNDTRTFYKQLKMPGASFSDSLTSDNDNSFKSTTVERINPQNMIRTDNKEQSIKKFLHMDGVKLNDSGCSVSLSGSSTGSTEASFRDAAAAKKVKEIKLTSILNMQKKIENDCSVDIRKIVKEMVFVGVVDRVYALFQHETRLYLSNTMKLRYVWVMLELINESIRIHII